MAHSENSAVVVVMVTTAAPAGEAWNLLQKDNFPAVASNSPAAELIRGTILICQYFNINSTTREKMVLEGG